MHGWAKCYLLCKVVVNHVQWFCYSLCSCIIIYLLYFIYSIIIANVSVLVSDSKIQLVSLCIQRIMRLLIIKTMWMQNCVSVIDLKWTNEWMNDWINHIITFIICTMGARNETIPFVLVSHDKSFHKYQNTLFRKMSTTVNLINCGSKTWV